MTRTYIDSGVLIAAARGNGELGLRALAVISDVSNREFVSSAYVRFETVPKPAYFKRDAEVRFYETFFANVAVWIDFDVDHFAEAMREACTSGLSAMDALHIVAAVRSGCTEFVTTESEGAGIWRTRRLKLVGIG